MDRDDDGVAVHTRRGSLVGSDHIFSAMHIRHSYRRIENARAVRYFVDKLGTRFDVVEVPDWFGEGLCLRKASTPIAMQIHTPLQLVIRLASQRFTPDIRLASWLERQAANRVSRICGPTNAAMRAVSELWHLNAAKCRVIPLPVELSAVVPQPIEETEPIVLFAGRLEPLKNPELILAAASAVISEISSAQFWFVGAGSNDYVSRLIMYSKSKGIASHVHFFGHCSWTQLATLRSRSRVCVVPSHFESFSYAAAEAMAAGRPVVAALAGGLPEVVTHGETGCVIALDDIDGWAKALIGFLQETTLAQRMGKAARQYAFDTFNPSVIARKKVDLWR